MAFKTKIDGGYIGALCIFTLVCGVLVYQCIVSFSVKLLLVCLAVAAFECLFILPTYLNTSYRLEDDGLRIRVGWFKNLIIRYADIFAYQSTQQEARTNYGLSDKRIVLYIKTQNGKNDVVTISPKDQQGFASALEARTGLAAKPKDPTFREIQDEYNKKTSPEQRRLARKRLWSALAKRYGNEPIKPESPESLEEKLVKQQTGGPGGTANMKE